MPKPFFFTIIILFCSHLVVAQTSTIGDLHWLKGTWKKAKSNTYESWEYDQDKNYLKGEGYKVFRGDTTVLESLTIKRKQGSYYYYADVPHNPAPVMFKFLQMDKESFICENPSHDFPQKITYRLLNHGQMEAKIEGNGKEMVFLFIKMK